MGGPLIVQRGTRQRSDGVLGERFQGLASGGSTPITRPGIDLSLRRRA